jgi:hypothetical protein
MNMSQGLQPGDRIQVPYKVPHLHRGARAFCLFKDCDVIVSGWTDARIR